MSKQSPFVCVGKFIKPHGIRGYVKLLSYTQNPSDIVQYGPLYDENGAHIYKVKIISANQELLIVSVDEVDTRTKAESLSGIELYVHRDHLPETDDDEFYYVDLIGLDVRLAGSEDVYGVVKAFHNYGAGDVIEITLTSGKEEIYSFDILTVPLIDIDEGFIVLSPPEKEFVNANDNHDHDKQPN